MAAAVLGERGDQRLLPSFGDPHQPQKAVDDRPADHAMFREGFHAGDRPKGRQVVTIPSMDVAGLLTNHPPFYFRPTFVPPPTRVCFDDGGRE
ncbi:hypothetical protein GCM10009654_13580 [Streptomyces hebeiensis]|uniref:Uncharacterized protein n=1 Tax=Streptomyces hebeiensis TaxID=229486 RepID=A0ABN1UM85_9ACTN